MFVPLSKKPLRIVGIFCKTFRVPKTRPSSFFEQKLINPQEKASPSFFSDNTPSISFKINGLSMVEGIEKGFPSAI